MPELSMNCDDIKRRIRKLKKVETRIRFGNSAAAGKRETKDLVWDTFFDLHDSATAGAKYSVHEISFMNKEQYHNVIDEFFFHVYYRFYKDNGMVNIPLYDPDMLSRLGLPVNADGHAIKVRFRELAMKYHPDTGTDTGGSTAKFIELVNDYRELMEKGKRD